MDRVSLPSTLRYLGEGAFAYTALTYVSLPEGLTEIGPNPFQGCYQLQGFSMSSNHPAFMDVDGMLMDKRTSTLVAGRPLVEEGDQIPEGTVIIGPQAFCSGIISVPLTFPSTVTTIGDSAFDFCSWPENTELFIPDTITSIGDFAFDSCVDLVKVSLPAGLAHIGDGLFYRCDFLDEITLHGPGEGLRLVDGALYSATDKTLVRLPPARATSHFTVPEGTLRISTHAFWGCTQLETVSLPDSLTSMGQGAFGRCYSLKEISIPSGVTSIEGSAFFGTGLTKIDLPEGLLSIGESAFEGCDLVAIALPASLTSIGPDAFRSCSSLAYVILPQALEELAWGAFTGCEALTAFALAGDHPQFEAVDGVLFDKQEKSLLFYPCAKKGTDYTVPEGTLSIGPGAFAGNQFLQRVELPPGLLGVGPEAFAYCENLQEINLPATVTEANLGIFNCPNLQKVDLEEGLQSLDGSLLSDCPGLTGDGLVLPSTLETIGYRVLSQCHGLTTLVIPEGVESIDHYAFSGCINLMEVSFPASLTSIGEGAFWGCGDIAFTAPKGSYASSFAEEYMATKQAEKEQIKESNPSEIDWSNWSWPEELQSDESVYNEIDWSAWDFGASPSGEDSY